MLLGLASNDSAEVRSAFGGLLFNNLLWPRNVRTLEPLLKSSDPRVQSQALAAFAWRGKMPSDLQRVRELANSSDSYVRFEAERVLALARQQ